MKLRRILLMAVSCAVAITLPAPAARAADLRTVTIRAADGIGLAANVVLPLATGPRPAIVFAASWALNDAEYLVQARHFATDGYVVLSYTPRGFWNSGGEIDVAGPLDIADVSSVLDWLVANTPTDPARIGMAGISYGSGIALIASGDDPRIRAVAALSTWTDLPESMYGGDTRRGQAAALLGLAGEVTGHPSEGLRTALARFFADREPDEVKGWALVRSAKAHLAAINRNRPAILLANAFGDSLFPPNQLVSFYAGLTGPKRLELAPGDHVAAEASGLAGLPNHVWDSARRWLGRYVAGSDDQISGGVQLWPRGGGAAESGPAWSAVAGAPVRYQLGGSRWYDQTGDLSATARAGWSRTIAAGIDTVACGGVVILAGGWEALSGIPPMAWIPAVNRLNALVWTSAPADRTLRVRGIATARLTVTPNVTGATIVAYLYAVDAAGTGRLITHAPVTGGVAGRAGALAVTFPATATDVSAGQRIALVVDTKDPLYLDVNQLGPLTVSSPAADPSWLSMPLR
jgi:dienelactone hydrolase